MVELEALDKDSGYCDDRNDDQMESSENESLGNSSMMKRLNYKGNLEVASYLHMLFLNCSCTNRKIFLALQEVWLNFATEFFLKKIHKNLCQGLFVPIQVDKITSFHILSQESQLRFLTQDEDQFVSVLVNPMLLQRCSVTVARCP